MSNSELRGAGDARLTKAHWSRAHAAYASDITTATTALNNLCQSCWYSFDAFIRRKEHALAQVFERRWVLTVTARTFAEPAGVNSHQVVGV